MGEQIGEKATGASWCWTRTLNRCSHSHAAQKEKRCWVDRWCCCHLDNLLNRDFGRARRERLTTRGETNPDLQIDSPRLFNYSRLIVIASHVLQVSHAFENEKENYSVYVSRSRFGEKRETYKRSDEQWIMKLFWPGPIPFYGGACSCKQQTSEGHDQMGAEYMNIWSRSLWKSNLSSESGVDCTFRAFYTFELFLGMLLLVISCSRLRRGFAGLMLGEHCIWELEKRFTL